MSKAFVMLVLVAGLSSGAWIGDSELDAMTDIPIITLYSRATSGTNALGERPSLCIRFTGDFNSASTEDSMLEAGSKVELEFYIHWSTYVGSGSLSCQGRIDDSTAVSYRLTPSTSNTSTFFTLSPLEEARLFRELLEGSEFTVRFTPYGENPITAVFSLSGLTAAALTEGVNTDIYLSLQDEDVIPNSQTEDSISIYGRGLHDESTESISHVGHRIEREP